MRMHRPLATALTTLALGGGLAAGLATASPAAAATDGQTDSVCADDVYLRSTPYPDGIQDGILHHGDNVYVYSHVGNGMVSVHAYGDIHRDGYVLESALC